MARFPTFVLLGTLTFAVGAPLVRAGDDEPCDTPADDCIALMAEKIGKKGWVGIVMDTRTEPVRIEKVIAGSPGEKAGLRPGDRLLELDGVAYTEANRVALEKAYRAMLPGNTIVYTVERAGARHKISIVLGRVPEEIRAQWVGEHVLKHHGHPAPSPKPAAG